MSMVPLSTKQQILLEDDGGDNIKYIKTLNSFIDKYKRTRFEGIKQKCCKKIELYINQRGMCKISGKILTCDNITIHHIVPRRLSVELHGLDNIQNLCLVDREYHNIIHNDYLNWEDGDGYIVLPSSKSEYSLINSLDESHLKILNIFRRIAGNMPIYMI